MPLCLHQQACTSSLVLSPARSAVELVEALEQQTASLLADAAALPDAAGTRLLGSPRAAGAAQGLAALGMLSSASYLVRGGALCLLPLCCQCACDSH